MRRPLAALVLAAIASWAVPALPGSTAVLAAKGGNLRLDVAATYRLDVPGHRVRVGMDVAATNLKADTATTYFYYDQLLFGVQPEARSVKATSGGTSLAVSNGKRDGYRQLTVHIPQLRHGQTRKVRIEFDLPGGKPRSKGDIRAGDAFASFYTWAWGDAGRSSVRVILPAGFDPTVTGSRYKQSKDAGGPVLTANDISDPTKWYLIVNAERSSKLTDDRLDLPQGEGVLIHAWPEDKTWQTRVHDVLIDAIPDLETRIGLPWPVAGDLEITETHTPLLEGYAGFYDPNDDTIVISEDLDEQTVVHEASHAWFGKALIDARWAYEGLADEYASRVLASLGRPSESPHAVKRTGGSAFALSAWPPPTAITDDQSDATEAYGYDASWTVMRAIVTDVGEARMRDVFRAASARTIPYLGEGSAESIGSADWRRFLDLLEELGGSTKAEGLFREWVLLPSDASSLDERATTRAAYQELKSDGGTWAVPYAVRQDMAVWEFAPALELMATAEAVLDVRDQLRQAETDLGVTSPTDQEAAFQDAGNAGNLVVVEEALKGRLAATAELAAAGSVLGEPAARSPIVTLGLLGEEPGQGLDAARAAYATGDLAAVASGTAATTAVMAGAESVGQTRALGIGIGLGVALLLLVVVALLLRRRRRRRQWALAGVATAAPTEPYATLAATSEPEPPVAGDDARERGADPD